MGCGASGLSSVGAEGDAPGVNRAVLGKYLLQKAQQTKGAGQLAPLTCPIIDQVRHQGGALEHRVRRRRGGAGGKEETRSGE